jgi:hypothetical protein
MLSRTKPVAVHANDWAGPAKTAKPMTLAASSGLDNFISM